MASALNVAYVGVHGGWGNALGPLTATLRSRGFEAHAPTLLGCAPDEDRRTVTLAAMAGQLTAFLREQVTGPVVLYAHSGGGPLMMLAAASPAIDVRRVVFINAGVPRTGECLLDLWGEQYQSSREIGQTRADKAVPMDKDVWRTVFTNNSPDHLWEHDFAPRACPVRWLIDRPNLDRFWALHQMGALPATFLYLTGDQAASRMTFAGLASRLAGISMVPVTASGGHMAIQIDPGPVADVLVSLSSGPLAAEILQGAARIKTT